MAKKSKKSNRARSVAGAALLLVPAALAAATAFMNAIVAKDNGVMSALTGDIKKKRGKRSKSSDADD